MRKKAFTLIELIAVLVILAILALIVTPLVMNIIRKARISADKRSIDAYGRSVELAIATYLLDNGDFPNSISDLTIEYSGDQVVCSITQLNSDSSVYITGCTVGGRTVDYVYGSDKSPSYTTYQVGDEVSYNNVDYYVIANSGTNEANVTLLKKTPLTTSEVNTYGGVETTNNHVNMYVTEDTSASYYQQALNINYNNSDTGIGGMAYYTSSTCTNYGTTDGCTTSYADSEIKYVVDAWKTAKAPAAIDARLISKQEIDDNFEFEEYKPCGDACGVVSDKITADWMYNSNYWYWTSTQYNDSSSDVWRVCNDGDLEPLSVYSGNGIVRPVITISKSNISNAGN
jgi:type IV pilus assembly protein PilA